MAKGLEMITSAQIRPDVTIVEPLESVAAVRNSQARTWQSAHRDRLRRRSSEPRVIGVMRDLSR